MHVEHPDSQPLGLKTGHGHGIRDVMIFQVKEHITATILDQTDNLRATSGKELLADLENTDLPLQFCHPVAGVFKVVDIESEDQSLLGTIHHDFLSGPGRVVRRPERV